MRIILSTSTEEAIDTVITLLFDYLSSHPKAVLGLATGRTMGPVYKGFVLRALENQLPMNQCSFFMLDEYIGLSEGHPSSFKAYIKNHFMTPLSLEASQFSFPAVHESSLDRAAENYEMKLKEKGIDIQLLGLGQNGHVGFNEPGSTKDSATRVVDLTLETIEANRGQFINNDIPKQALSMGISSIMVAKNLVMLVTGKSKSDAIKYLINHHDDPSCPVTYLKSHPHFTLILDPEAASKINLKI